MKSEMITVLDPTSKSTKKELPMAARPDRLEGKVMGILWNTKPGADVLLNRFAELLDERFHLAQILRRTKKSQAYGADEAILNELATKCDFIITGTGD